MTGARNSGMRSCLVVSNLGENHDPADRALCTFWALVLKYVEQDQTRP